jgi:hypothetical protein
MNNDFIKIRKQTFGSFMATLNKPYNRCLAPGESCENLAIRAHSIQNANILERLQVNGHVIAPKLDLNFAKGPRVSFEKVGRKQATTFHGLCTYHDAQIFQPIEANDLELTNPQHLFLLSYRAVLKEVHSTTKSARDTQTGYCAGIETGLYPNTLCAPGIHAGEHMMLAYMADEYKLRYDRVYLSQEWDLISHYKRDLCVAPGVALNTMISTGRYSHETDSVAYAILNIFPVADTTFLVVSFLNEHSKHFSRSIKKFLRSGPILQKLSYLILKRCSNFVLSPNLFDSFSDDQIRECLMHYERNMGDNTFEPKRSNLINIFECV